jgi:hypothetical protein
MISTELKGMSRKKIKRKKNPQIPSIFTAKAKIFLKRLL